MKNFFKKQKNDNSSLDSAPIAKDSTVKKALTIVGVVIAGFFILGTVISSVYMLNEDQDAVVSTFGAPTVVSNSGLHFAIPYVQTVEKVDMSVQGMPIGYNSDGYFVENESLMITKDFNFVNVDFYVEYQVTDAVAFKCSSDDPTLILRTLALSYIRDTVGSYTIDDVLTVGKSQIQSEIKAKLMERIEKEKIGISVVSVVIQDSEPPTSAVSAAFKAVEDAKQKAEEEVNNANAYKNKTIPKAEADKQARIKEAEAQVSRFTKMYEEYVKFPEVTKIRMYYESLEELLPNLKVIIQDGDGSVINVLGGQVTTGSTGN